MWHEAAALPSTIQSTTVRSRVARSVCGEQKQEANYNWIRSEGKVKILIYGAHSAVRGPCPLNKTFVITRTNDAGGGDEEEGDPEDRCKVQWPFKCDSLDWLEFQYHFFLCAGCPHTPRRVMWGESMECRTHCRVVKGQRAV